MNYLDYVNFIEMKIQTLDKNQILNLKSKEFSMFKKLFDNDEYETFKTITSNIINGYYNTHGSKC
jgi:hypothetical protein